MATTGGAAKETETNSSVAASEGGAAAAKARLELSRKYESRGLFLSLAGNAAISVLGLVFAVVASSNAILLDGVYSVVSLVMALLAIRVAGVVSRPPSERFPFGYAHFEPIFNTVRSMLIVTVCAFALFTAIHDLRVGGEKINSTMAVIYGAVATVSCFGVSWYQRRASRETHSPLLDLDSRSWLLDGFLSLVSTIAFVIAFILSETSLDHWVPYVDPILLIALVALIVPIPIVMLKANLRQVFQAGPPEEDQQRVRELVHGAIADLPIVRDMTRMVRVGRYFYIVVYILVDESDAPPDTKEIDAVRERVFRAVARVHPSCVVDLIVTTDEKWMMGGYMPDSERGLLVAARGDRME
jgi:cation diffusion facilitator family transporter